jgi:DNA-binding FadR family transcriptional regulator
MSSLERIIDLIEAGDGSAAEAHWRAHLEAGNRVWLSGYSDALLDVLD